MYDVRSLKTKQGISHFAEFLAEDETNLTCWLPGSSIQKYSELKVKECFLYNNSLIDMDNGKSYYDTRRIPI